jgi:hypothetical protein
MAAVVMKTTPNITIKIVEPTLELGCAAMSLWIKILHDTGAVPDSGSYITCGISGVKL